MERYILRKYIYCFAKNGLKCQTFLLSEEETEVSKRLGHFKPFLAQKQYIYFSIYIASNKCDEDRDSNNGIMEYFRES